MDVKRILDFLGLTGPKWQWRAMRWQRQWDGWRESWRQRRQHVTYQNKFCNACGALMDREAKTCPRCQAPAPSWNAQFMKRVFGLVLPQWNPVTNLILAANGLNLVIVMALFGPSNLWSPQGEVLFRMGALVPPFFFEGEYWRVITYGYLHIGIIHIAFNLFALSQVGPFLEEEIGGARFFAVYTLTLVGGGVADLILRGGSIILIAGASGALFGLIGFGVSYAHYYGGTLGRQQRDFFIRWAIYGFLFGLFVGADNIAHAGGFISGALLGYVIAKERRSPENLTRQWTALAYLCLVATILSFVWLFIYNLGQR